MTETDTAAAPPLARNDIVTGSDLAAAVAGLRTDLANLRADLIEGIYAAVEKATDKAEDRRYRRERLLLGWIALFMTAAVAGSGLVAWIVRAAPPS